MSIFGRRCGPGREDRFPWREQYRHHQTETKDWPSLEISSAYKFLLKVGIYWWPKPDICYPCFWHNWQLHPHQLYLLPQKLKQVHHQISRSPQTCGKCWAGSRRFGEEELRPLSEIKCDRQIGDVLPWRQSYLSCYSLQHHWLHQQVFERKLINYANQRLSSYDYWIRWTSNLLNFVLCLQQKF